MSEPRRANFETELKTARMMIEGPDCKAIVVGIMIDAGEAWVAGSVSNPCRRGDALRFAKALREEAERLESIALGKIDQA